MSALELQVADRFPAGTKVGVYPRVHDFFTPGQTPAVKSATVDKHGVISLSGLVEHGPYFLAAEVDQQVPTPRGSEEVKIWRSVAFTASSPETALDRDATSRQAEAESAARAEVVSKTSIDTATNPSTTAPPTGQSRIVEGPRGTGNVSTIGPVHPLGKTVPYPRIEDQKKGTPLRSHTATGEAHPVPDDERQPKPAQSDVPKRAKQRSDTPLGEATPVAPGEDQPAASQEDIPARTRQASATATGEATPVKQSSAKRKARGSKAAKKGGKK